MLKQIILNMKETAMAKTVGLPLGIATVQILNGHIKKPGLHVPVDAAIYLPILNELEKMGIVFENNEIEEKI